MQIHLNGYEQRLVVLGKSFVFFCLLFCLESCAVAPVESVPDQQKDISNAAGLSFDSSAYQLLDTKRILVLPIFSIVKVFRGDAPRVHEHLITGLDGIGYDCFVISDKQYAEIRANALVESGAIYNPQVGERVPLRDAIYIDYFIKALNKIGEFDLLLFPELVLRDAYLKSGQMHWDKAQRQLLVDGEMKRQKLPEKVSGLSLKLSAYKPDGTQVGIHYGGIGLPYYLDTTQRPPRFKLRNHLFSATNIEMGVKYAIRPFRKSN